MSTVTLPAPSNLSEKAKRLATYGGTPVSTKAIPFMSTALTDADIESVIAVLKSGMLRAATKCAAFEDKWTQLTDAKFSMTCANGTCALQLAYEPLIRPGDDVLVPAWSYIATVSMIVARGANPVFVDANPDTFQIDVKDLARKVTKNTTAVAVTHLYGCPVDIDGVQAIAEKHNLMVIYDAAQAHLATYKGKGLGAYGDAVTYSLYATKNLATGEGGIITCNDEGLAREIRLLRSHGETDKYLHESVGYNYRMNDMAGAIGLSRLDRLPQQTEQRRKNAARYDAILKKIKGISGPGTTPNSVPVYHLYTCKLDTRLFSCTRDDFCKALMAEGVPTATHYPRSLPEQPALEGYDRDDTPVAKALASQVFCLPMHHDLTDDHFRIVEEAMNKVAEAYRV